MRKEKTAVRVAVCLRFALVFRSVRNIPAFVFLKDGGIPVVGDEKSAVWKIIFHTALCMLPLRLVPDSYADRMLLPFQIKAMVSLAIISSSSVGMTQTVTLLSGVEMMASSPRTVLFLALSSVTPR